MARECVAMRPRQEGPGKAPIAYFISAIGLTGFNEARARRPGMEGLSGGVGVRRHASMRPRHDDPGIVRYSASPDCAASRFNVARAQWPGKGIKAAQTGAIMTQLQ